jgi:hypothetical protein
LENFEEKSVKRIKEKNKNLETSENNCKIKYIMKL